MMGIFDGAKSFLEESTNEMKSLEDIEEKEEELKDEGEELEEKTVKETQPQIFTIPLENYVLKLEKVV